MVELKNIQSKKFYLGQYFTDCKICDDIVGKIQFRDSIVIEPSFGTGNFLRALKGIPNQKIGIEIDPDLFYKIEPLNNTKILLMNFYDFTISSGKPLCFIGNPPYRTPAYSLTTHRDFIKSLTKRYSVRGLREEAVFFILHSIDLILRNKNPTGEIHYILPKSILKNNSKFFQRFKSFLKETCQFLSIDSIQGTEFDGVYQDLVYLALRVDGKHETQECVLVDGVKQELDRYLCLEEDDIIPFQKIFKKTYLGSVPCESLLMSVSGESVEEFRDRLCKIIASDNLTERQLYSLLCHQGRFHLKIFEKAAEDPAVTAKLKIILSYVRNIQEKEGILAEFQNLKNYKSINGRTDVRYYFRCEKLKPRKNFVYELNPNPCPSFYFTGNPSNSSTDYFGFCDYDINRNVSPGANRTVPVANLKENLTDAFKKWWRINTEEPYENIFEYIIFISRTKWYRDRKRNNKRFYFGIPPFFVKTEDRKDDIEIPQTEMPDYFKKQKSG